jgi:hypothetical protein
MTIPNAPVIWLNGAFGAGKTTIARGLAAEVPQAMVFDPEPIGLTLRKTIPPDLRSTADFQDIALWRRLTRDAIEGLVEQYNRPLIVPMTLVRSGYFDEIIGSLRRAGLTVHHFTLVATPATLRRRLATRLSRPASTLWALRQVTRCVSALESPAFHQHVATDNTPIAQIVKTIRRDAAL